MKSTSIALLLGLAAVTCVEPNSHHPEQARVETPVVPPASEQTPVRIAETSSDSSLYVLEPRLTDHRGERRSLASFRGQPLIISMFYASCPYACPLLISDIGRLLRTLDPNAKQRVRILLVSLDPERDTPKDLAALKRAHGLDDRWVLASAPTDDVRELAAVLGVKYRRLESGAINHSTVVTVLDRGGTSRFRLEGLEQPLADIASTLNTLATATHVAPAPATLTGGNARL